MFSACPSVCACRAYVRACVLSVQRQSPTALPSTSSFRQALVWFCTYSPAVELAKRQSTKKTCAWLVVGRRLVSCLTDASFSDHEPASVSLAERWLVTGRQAAVAIGDAGARCLDDGRGVTASWCGGKWGETQDGSVAGNIVDSHRQQRHTCALLQ